MALVYAELGSHHRDAGGEYAIIRTVLGARAGRGVLALLVFAQALIVALVALSVAASLVPAWTGLQRSLLAASVLCGAGLCAARGLHRNVHFAGWLLLLEIALLAAICITALLRRAPARGSNHCCASAPSCRSSGDYPAIGHARRSPDRVAAAERLRQRCLFQRGDPRGVCGAQPPAHRWTACRSRGPAHAGSNGAGRGPATVGGQHGRAASLNDSGSGRVHRSRCGAPISLVDPG